MDIVDLSSDSESEEGIVYLSSDSEDSNEFHSCRGDDTDYEDPVSPFHLAIVPHSGAPDQNSVEQPTGWEYDDWHEIAKKEYDDWFSRRKASSSYSPAENRSTNEMSSGVSNDIKRVLPLSITYGSAAKSEHRYTPNGEHQLPQSFTNGNGMSSSTMETGDILFTIHARC